MLRLPLYMMKKNLEAKTSQKPEPTPKIKFLTYSAHDWTVAQLLLFLDASNGKFENVPFASNI